MSAIPPPSINIPQRGPSPSPSLPSGGFSVSPANSMRPQTPSSLYSNNPFDFPVPSIPPRLSRVGRRISEMGMNVLVGPDLIDEPPPPRRDPLVRAGEVPGMGDEPIMCPFCNKPLPPAFILTQMAHTHANSQEKKRVERKASVTRRPGDMSRSASGSGPAAMGMSRVLEGPGSSVAVSSTASAPSSARPSVSGEVRQLPNGTASPATKSASDITTDALLESTRPKPGEVLPKATAESLLPSVKSAETADTAGASSIISPEDVKKWSSMAGIDLSSATPPAAVEKVIPALPPPPPPSSTVADRLKKTERSESGSSSKFGGFFGRSSKAQDEDSDDDEGQGTGGYAKLDAPPSPDREEAPSWLEKAKAESVPEKVEVAEEKQPDVSEPKEQGPSDEALRKLLVEVLGKVNSMSKSHEDLLHSHTTLLTSLKIARSNLAMAEANSEMLEEQLKRAPPPSIRPTPPSQSTTQAPTRSATPSGTRSATPVAPLPVRSASSAIPSIVVPSAPARKSLEEPLPHAAPAPRRSEDGRPIRPQSMIMPPPNMYNNGPSTGPASSTAGKESKGMFGFLGGGKTKVPGLGTINIPSAKELQASAARFGDTLAGPSRPGTPGREAGQFFDYHTPAQYAPVQNENRTQRSVSGDQISRAPSPNPSINGNGPRGTPAQSPSSTTSLQAPSAVRPQPIPPAIAAELAKLRTAYITSQTRMEAMNKELTELKKGKVEMEAELESLSQALFEEANKMVSDERKRRIEMEEALKEVKEEREVFRETIKVLGGQADIAESEKEGDEKETSGDEAIVPRDLDKHYEALRKTIHHVADGTAPTAAFEEAIKIDGSVRGSGDSAATGSEAGLGGGRKVSAGLAEANPWAEVDFGTGGKPVISHEPEAVDPLAKAGGEAAAGAAAEMERGG